MTDQIIHFTIPVKFDTERHPIQGATPDNWFDVVVKGAKDWGEAEMAARKMVIERYGRQAFFSTYKDDDDWVVSSTKFYPDGCIKILEIEV